LILDSFDFEPLMLTVGVGFPSPTAASPPLPQKKALFWSVGVCFSRLKL